MMFCRVSTIGIYFTLPYYIIGCCTHAWGGGGTYSTVTNVQQQPVRVYSVSVQYGNRLSQTKLIIQLFTAVVMTIDCT